MASHTLAPFPDELLAAKKQIRERARSYGLDFFPVIFEMCDYEQMNQIAAYGGFPQRYPHWRFGMEYERLRKQHHYGLGRIYEMVINNDPCYAYLQESNALVDQKLVIAHVYGHCDFFKNNLWFSRTNRKMMDEMANHSTHVRKHIEKHGYDTVEKWLDVCLSVEDLIDPHSMFLKRGPSEMPKVEPKREELFYEGSDLHGEGKHAEAMDRFERCLAIDPNYVDALLGKAMVHLGRKEFDAQVAVETYRNHLAAWVEMERQGFDGIAINEHHSTPSCVNVGANMTAATRGRRERQGRAPGPATDYHQPVAGRLPPHIRH